MEELLTIRKDLVQKYFAKKSYVNPITQLLHHEFNTTPPFPNSEESITLDSFPTAFTSKPDFQCCFNSMQIRLITHSVNAVHLFFPDVSEVEVKSLFTCCLKYPLKSACNRRIAFFFDALCEYKFISTRWQHVIDKNGHILSSALNSSELSTALNEAKQNDGCIYRTIEFHIQRIVANEEYKVQI